jgi:hypothetical protein
MDQALNTLQFLEGTSTTEENKHIQDRMCRFRWVSQKTVNRAWELLNLLKTNPWVFANEEGQIIFEWEIKGTEEVIEIRVGEDSESIIRVSED